MFRTIGALLIICCLSIAHGAFAQVKHRPNKLLISYLNHPTIVDKYIPLIRSAYQELGIRVEFVEIIEERENLSVSEGLVDGAVAKSALSMARYNNIEVIFPPLSIAAQYLVCQSGLPCNKAILKSNEKIMASKEVTINFPELFRDNTIQINSMAVARKLFEHKRINYMIYPAERGNLVDMPVGNYVLVAELEVVHVLNSKHKELVDDVSEQLAKQLNKQRDQ